MHWSDLVSEQPSLAQLAYEKLIKPGVLLVGTVRRDGSPRISGVEPLIMDGQLWLSMLRDSMKARDLHRDQRLVLNSIVIGLEPAVEVKVRGVAQPESDHPVQERYAAAVPREIGWQPVVGRFALFSVKIDEVSYLGYDPETHGQHFAHWPSGVEYVRPATTPTSLGLRQRVRRLLR